MLGVHVVVWVMDHDTSHIRQEYICFVCIFFIIHPMVAIIGNHVEKFCMLNSSER